MKPFTVGCDDLIHATLARQPFNRPGWVFENKLDGFRALARREGDRVELLSGIVSPRDLRAVEDGVRAVLGF